MAEVKSLRPVKREPAAIPIASQLTQAIMDGSLPPGHQLGEAELAAQLGVSRGPLREAMQRLVQQGIAVSEPHRGVFVTKLDEDDVRDIYFTRSAMEAAACPGNCACRARDISSPRWNRSARQPASETTSGRRKPTCGGRSRWTLFANPPGAG